MDGPRPGAVIEEVAARGTVAEVAGRLAAAVRGAGMEVFAQVDHAAGARGAGLEIADEILLLVGAPQVGTALMQADARSGLDLPLRVLVRDVAGTTRIAWRDPRALSDTYALDDVIVVLERMAGALRRVVEAAA